MAYYFAADVHLGLSFRGGDPRERERLFVAWLDAIEADCEGLFLVGDIFDFWFEYKRVVPKGFVRVLGRLASFCDRGIPVHFFPGNHDMWVGDYFAGEIGMTVHDGPQTIELQGRRIFIAHGDGLGKTDRRYRILSRIFHSRSLRRVFSVLIHPDAWMRFGHTWSSSNRHGREGAAHEFRGEDEPLVCFARQYAAAADPAPDYFVCGHIHTPVEYPLDDNVKLIVLGQWVDNNRPIFARLDNGTLELAQFVPASESFTY